MTPVKFRSKWCEKDHFLIKTVIRDEVKHAVVPNGTQAKDGLIFENRRQANTWLKENGFTEVK